MDKVFVSPGRKFFLPQILIWAVQLQRQPTSIIFFRKKTKPPAVAAAATAALLRSTQPRHPATASSTLLPRYL